MWGAFPLAIIFLLSASTILESAGREGMDGCRRRTANPQQHALRPPPPSPHPVLTAAGKAAVARERSRRGVQGHGEAAGCLGDEWRREMRVIERGESREQQQPIGVQRRRRSRRRQEGGKVGGDEQGGSAALMLRLGGWGQGASKVAPLRGGQGDLQEFQTSGEGSKAVDAVKSSGRGRRTKRMTDMGKEAENWDMLEEGSGESERLRAEPRRNCTVHNTSAASLGCSHRHDTEWVAFLCRVCGMRFRRNSTLPIFASITEKFRGDLKMMPLSGRCYMCSRRAKYAGQKSAERHCAMHRLPGDTIFITAYCQGGAPQAETENQEKSAASGGSGGREADEASGRAEALDSAMCTKQPVYGDVGGKARFCLEHRLEGMVDLRNPRCTHDNCNNRAVYGDSSTAKAVHCFSHKSPDEYDLVHKRCRHLEGCFKNPCFGDARSMVPHFCHHHKMKNHVDVKNRRCEFTGGCSKHPSFGSSFDGIPRYCREHKQADHVPYFKGKRGQGESKTRRSRTIRQHPEGANTVKRALKRRPASTAAVNASISGTDEEAVSRI